MLFPANSSLTVNHRNLSFTTTDRKNRMQMHGVFDTGNFEVGVHIADVSYFVEEGSVLDATASQRATSVYLVQKVRARSDF